MAKGLKKHRWVTDFFYEEKPSMQYHKLIFEMPSNSKISLHFFMEQLILGNTNLKLSWIHGTSCLVLLDCGRFLHLLPQPPPCKTLETLVSKWQNQPFEEYYILCNMKHLLGGVTWNVCFTHTSSFNVAGMERGTYMSELFTLTQCFSFFYWGSCLQ